MFLENALSLVLPLEGEWEFKLAAGPAQTIAVPSAWEAQVKDKITAGPALYRREINIPESWLGAAMIVLEADAISFAATIRLNGQTAGTHQGLWSPFQIDLTPYVQAGDNLLEIEVWKPGSRFPIRETLSGFLPDLAASFGGIWQGIRLRVFSWAAFSDVRSFAYGGGWLDVQGRIVGLGERRKNEVFVEIVDAADQRIASTRGEIADDHTFAAHIETGAVQNWAPGGETALYSVRLALRAREADIARVTRRVGFRDLEIEAEKVKLNKSPAILRGVLDWGWDATRLCPTPSRAEVLDSFAKARALGFNLFKLCLFAPEETVFEAADETGMLLWLEMPLWLPNVTPALRELALREYRDLFSRLHHHPSIAVLSLGCELNAQADAEFLAALNALAREWFPNALHCDNSGSAEAYDGAPTALSDFYDYHFYTDPHFFQPLVQHFARPYRPRKPWLYGEFCDADTLRDFSLLNPEPWWLTEPTALERDDFLATRDYKARLQQAGIADGGAALTTAARRQATAVRKFIIEQARANNASGGYVVSGWSDTPITTSGIVDDRRELKFSPAEWQRFNGDRVLIMDRERRRRWVGGDRPIYKDPFCWQQGETVEIHLALANGGEAIEDARLHWRLATFSGPALAEGEKEVSIAGGEVQELAMINTRLPLAAGLLELRLIAALQNEPGSAILAQNVWPLWAAPHAPAVETKNRIEFELTEAALSRVYAGDSLLVWLNSPDARFTRALPFWREAIHVFEPSPLWDSVPQPGYADMRFFSLATDFAIEPDKLKALLGVEATLTPIWRRFDARQLFWSDYIVAARYGAGRMILTSLRFAGGLGCQPQTLNANPLGAWLLESLLKLL